MNLDQFINKDLNADDLSHSSGLGSVAGGGGAGGLSMDRRLRLTRKDDRLVRDYHRWSELGTSHSVVKPRTAQESFERNKLHDEKVFLSGRRSFEGNRQSSALDVRREADVRSIERRQHFIEPTARNLDKFA